MERLREAWADRGLVVLGVTRSDAESARAFLDATGAGFPVLVGADTAREDWGVDVIWGSVYYLVDPSRRIRVEGLDAAEALLLETLGPPDSP